MPQVEQVGFSCAACGKQYRWKPELAGKAVKCKCGSAIRVPKEDPNGAGAASAAPVAKPAPAAAKAAAPVKAAKPKPAQAEAGGLGGGGDLDALMALAQQEAASAEDAASQADSHFCANCRSRMSPEAVICVNCGYDRRKNSVLAAAKVKDPNARRLFGLLGPKKEKPGKVVDAMAPQGSFFLGLVVSFALALAASVIWFLVAWGVGWDVYFLVALVGIGAGVGMQIGQKGYSTLGGFAAVGVTLLVMIIARLAVVLAIIIPMMSDEALAEAADDEPEVPERVEIQPFDPANIFKEREVSGDGSNNAPINPNEDPRVVEKVSEQVYKDLHINPDFATGDQHNMVELEARIRAQTMPADIKKAMIADMDKRAEEERFFSMLVNEEVNRIEELNPDANILAAMDGIKTKVAEKIRKMTPEDKKKERARIKELEKARMAKAQTRFAEMQKEWKKKADEEAVSDGFDSADAGMDEEGEEGEGEDEDGLETTATANAAATPATQGARPSAAATPAAAAPTPGAAASAAGADEEEDDDAGGAAIALGLGFILFMVFFGGIKSFVFLILSLFLAYRTAAGSTFG